MLYLRMFLMLTLFFFLGCDEKESKNEQRKVPPGEYAPEMHRTRDGTCHERPAFECIEGKPCARPKSKAVKCPYTYFRYARSSKGQCYIEPFVKCETRTLCSADLMSKPCPPELTDKGFILRKGDGCELTLIKDDKRTTTKIPCPSTLPQPIP